MMKPQRVQLMTLTDRETSPNQPVTLSALPSHLILATITIRVLLIL